MHRETGSLLFRTLVQCSSLAHTYTFEGPINTVREMYLPFTEGTKLNIAQQISDMVLGRCISMYTICVNYYALG